MGVADDDVAFLADRHDLGHRLEHHLVLGLARVAQFLRQVALADDDRADAGHVLQHVAQVLDAKRVLDLHDDEQFAMRGERPHVGALVIFLLGDAPVARRLHRAVATDALRLIERLVLEAGVAAGGDRVIGLLDRRDMRPHDAVATEIQRLLGEELVLLDTVGGDAREWRDRRRDTARTRDLAAVEQILEAVAQAADVPALVFALEHDAVILGLLQLDGHGRLALGEQ